MAILNLTQHNATEDQINEGVVELQAEIKQVLKGLLDFSEMPTRVEIMDRAASIAKIANRHGAKHAMIGGAPFLMGALESALKDYGITPVYAFSQRISVEKTQDDGSVIKTAIFKHIGFVEV